MAVTEVGPPPPFDPECAAVLAPIADLVPVSITSNMIPEVRASERQMAPSTDEQLRFEGRFSVEEQTLSNISLLICRPTSVSGTVGAVYYIHGGGMIAGDNRSGVLVPLAWAAELGLAVISVEYRLAPEHPHPVPAEDCYTGLEWVVAHARDLGIDPDRVVLAGVSAGGGLAAAVALMARDRGGPALLGQVLMCPMLDDRNDTASSLQMAGIGLWDRTSNETGWSALLGATAGGPDVSPYAAPARASDLGGLPPAFIDVGSAETFRDEDVSYASRIWQAGGIAELHVWPGGFHGYSLMAPDAQLSRDTVQARLNWLRRLLAS